MESVSMSILPLLSEEWREYDFGGRVYRINAPKALYLKGGSQNHRVLDGEGVVHCVPAPCVAGCALRWKARDATKPVEF